MALSDYLLAEAALSRLLRGAWGKVAAAAFAEVADALARGDAQAAYEVAASLRVELAGAVDQAKVSGLLGRAAAYGASTAARGGKFDALDEDFVGAAAERLVSALEAGVEDKAYDWIVSTAHRLEVGAEGAADLAAGKSYLRAFQSFRNVGDELVNLSTSLHTSRLATWGFTGEAESRGVQTYELHATVDGRTSKFCTMINGRRFQVADARAKVVSVLESADPRVAQPWPRQTDEWIARYRAMTPDQLTALGLHIPPFHGMCRTLCRRVQGG